MSDVTIPADDAWAAANVLRIAMDGYQMPSKEEVQRLINLLVPPTLSLRDEVKQATEVKGPCTQDEYVANILAVIRRHVEALPRWYTTADGMRALDRGDVLRLLGVDDE